MRGCLMSITFNLADKSNSVIFAFAYATTGLSELNDEKDMFRVDLYRTVSRVPENDHLSLVKDADTRTRVRGTEENREVTEAYEKDSRASDSNVIALLPMADGNKLIKGSDLFSTRKGGSSRTFNGVASHPADREDMTCIITRQGKRRVVRRATVHLLA